MTLDVPPTRIGDRRGRWRAALVLLAAASVVGVGLLTGQLSAAGRAAPAPVPAVAASRAPASASGAGVTAVRARPAPAARPLPATLGCHDVAFARCLALVQAALSALLPGDPGVTSAEAWSSLLCRDLLDCPLYRLAAGRPLGSVVLRFADGGPNAWLNVVQPDAAAPGGAAPAPEAWPIDWSG